MKKLSLIVLFAPFLLILQGCPYHSEVPITEFGDKIPKSFMGTFYETKDLKTPISIRKKFIIEKEKNNNLVIQEMRFDGDDKKWKVEDFTGHISKVNEEYFLNLVENKHFDIWDDDVQESNSKINEPPKKYYLYKICIEGSIIRLKGVSEYITEKFTDSKTLYDFIAKHQGNSYFYNDQDLVLINKENVD